MTSRVVDNDAQEWTRAEAGQASGCGGMGKPASVIVYQHQFPRDRLLPRRANCRGKPDSSALFFPRVELNGHHTALARAQTPLDQRKASTAVRAKVDQFSVPSRVPVFDEKHRSERHLEPCSPNRGIRYPQ